MWFWPHYIPCLRIGSGGFVGEAEENFGVHTCLMVQIFVLRLILCPFLGSGMQDFRYLTRLATLNYFQKKRDQPLLHTPLPRLPS